jgi:hypothetical protein
MYAGYYAVSAEELKLPPIFFRLLSLALLLFYRTNTAASVYDIMESKSGQVLCCHSIYQHKK